ncbi:MAG: putative negative regulator of RcsB-dependent stress response [Pseudohongiellaceae bacterium]
MASYESDEEQIEALKNWWKENGNSLLMGVVIVLVVLFGSRQWQGAQLAKAEEASELYDSIFQLSALNQTSVITESTIAELESSNEQLRSDYTDSIYARYGALIMASMYVNQEAYEQAANELNWVLDNPDLGFMKSAEEELFLTARLRLARVRLAQGMAQEALDLVTAVEPGGLEAGYSEVQGDAYLQLGQAEQARSAYQRALSLAPDNANFIELKILGIGS